MPRPRLFRRLDRRAQRVIWIWGPPGAGKTALIASYVAARKVHTLWYQLDGGDRDPATVVYYLRAVAPRRRRALPLLTPEYRLGLTVFAQRFFRDLYGRLRRPFMVVFDNYERVPADSLLHDVLREALEQIPDGGRVIVASRGEPPATLARLRAHRAVDVLAWDDLRLRALETRALVRHVSRQRVAGAAADSLHRTTDGWMAGLLLMLEGKRPPVLSSAEMARVPAVLFDYFAGEVFDTADVETRRVLLHTACVPRATAAMAATLTSVPGAGRILEDLHRQNYFTSKHYGTDVTYQYHPLFRAFLLARAEVELRPEERQGIRCAAAALVERDGQIDDAAALLVETGAWTELGELIRRHAPALLAQGRGRTVESWLGNLPEELIEAAPWLEYWRGACRLPVDPAASLGHFERAFAKFRTQHDDVGALLAWSGAVDALVLQWNGLRPADRWIAALEILLAESAGFPSPDVEARVSSSMFQVLLYRQPGHPDLEAWGQRAEEAAKAIGAVDLLVMIGHGQVYGAIWRGFVTRAVQRLASFKDLIRLHEVSPLAQLMMAFAEGATHLSSGALTECVDALTAARGLASSNGIHVVDAALRIHTIIAALLAGDLVTAGQILEEMRASLRTASALADVYHFHYLCAWHARLRDDLPLCTVHLETARRLVHESGMLVLAVQSEMAMAELLHARRERDAAEVTLARACAHGVEMRSLSVEYITRLVEAEFALDRGDLVAARAALGQALPLGRREGIFGFPWLLRSVMARLCVVALEAGIEVEFVRDLIRKFRLVPVQPPKDVEAWPWPIRLRTLGSFEVSVDDAPLRFAGKVQRKPLGLLKAIIALGGHDVREQRLTDALWPDAEGDAAQVALTSAVYRLRRLLGHEEAVRRQDGRVSLDARWCWVDLWALERLLDRAEAIMRSATEDAWSEALAIVAKLGALYRGPFLGDTVVAPDSTPITDRIRRRIVRVLALVGQEWERRERWSDAAEYYERAIEVDACAEDVYRRLMMVYHRLGRPSDVDKTYQRCRDSVSRLLDRTTSSHTETLARTLRAT